MTDQHEETGKAANTLASAPFFFPGPAVPMDTMLDEVSDFDTMYLLDLVIEAKGKKLSIHLTDSDTVRMGKKFPVSMVSLSQPVNLAELQKAADKLLAGNGTDVDFEKKGQDNHKQKATKLSLNFPGSAFLLFRINGKIENVRFSSQYNAFTREDKSDSPLKYPARMTGTTLVRDGDGLGVNCTAAMFAYQWDSGATEVWERFNIHLEIVDGKVDDAHASFIPIIVDPDVRFPGGNGPP